MARNHVIGKARDLSKVTHPVRARTKIREVPAPPGGGGANKGPDESWGEQNPETRKPALVFSDTA